MLENTNHSSTGVALQKRMETTNHTALDGGAWLQQLTRSQKICLVAVFLFASSVFFTVTFSNSNVTSITFHDRHPGFVDKFGVLKNTQSRRFDKIPQGLFHQGLRYLVLISYHDEDVSWMKNMIRKVDVQVLNYDLSKENHQLWFDHHKYMRYIIMNYDSLPERLVFMHAGKKDWHSKKKDGNITYYFKESFDVDRINWSFVEATGYMSMSNVRVNRLNITRGSSAPAAIELKDPQMKTKSFGESWGVTKFARSYFEAVLSEPPRDIFVWASMEFATTSAAIRRWPRRTWETLFNLTHCCGMRSREDHVHGHGVAMEFVFPVLLQYPLPTGQISGYARDICHHALNEITCMQHAAHQSALGRP